MTGVCREMICLFLIPSDYKIKQETIIHKDDDSRGGETNYIPSLRPIKFPNKVFGALQLRSLIRLRNLQLILNHYIYIYILSYG